MEREANYTAVGAFVLLIATLGGFFVYWYAGSGDARDYKRYEIYFEGSVSGLIRGSTVRYLGVDVGRVVDIRIDKRASDRVQVIADIDSQTPISKQTLASLSMQGVTGLLYIDLLANAKASRVMASVPSEKYPVIDSVQSNFDRLLSSLPDLVGRATVVVDRAARVLSDENIKAFSKTMENIQHVVGDAARRDARRGGGGGRSQGHARRCARRGRRRASAHRHLGPGPGRRLRADPLDLREPRQDHGEPGSTHDRPS